MPCSGLLSWFSPFALNFQSMMPALALILWTYSWLCLSVISVMIPQYVFYIYNVFFKIGVNIHFYCMTILFSWECSDALYDLKLMVAFRIITSRTILGTFIFKQFLCETFSWHCWPSAQVRWLTMHQNLTNSPRQRVSI